MAVYVREDGNGDYTSLSAAVAANQTDIEIHGVWSSAEDSDITIDDDNTVIEAKGASRHSGYVKNTPLHFRLRSTGTAIAVFEVTAASVELIGLDIKTNAYTSTGMAIRANNNGLAGVKDCIIWQDPSESLNRHGIYFYNGGTASGAKNCTIENCVIFGMRNHGIYTLAAASGVTATLNVNSCTLYNNGRNNESGIEATQVLGTLSVNVFNSIVVDNNADFVGVGTLTWNIDYCIDSDGSIDTEDTGAVGCLTSHNPTDDDTKNSDGDWVIFRNITTTPYDLRLAYNAYNEAVEMHASSSGAGLTVPNLDLITKPRESSYSCGAYQMPWIVEEDGNYDYTTLNSAVTANKKNIEIWGEWSSAEDANVTIDDQYTFIEAVGKSRHPGHELSSPTYYRLETTSGTYCISLQEAYCTLKGICAILDSSSVTVSNALQISNSGSGWGKIDSCLIPKAVNGGAAQGHGIRLRISLSNTLTAYITNCIISDADDEGLLISTSALAGATINAYIQSCTIWNCTNGIELDETNGSITAYIFNTISVGNSGYDYYTNSGAPTWDIHYCIDSDGSIDTEDTGAVGCLTSHNPTDDCTKNSDGDWVIFNNITSAPYDLRLCKNAYNEAIDMHSVFEFIVNHMPGIDIEGNPRIDNYDCGAYELPSGAVCWGHDDVEELNIRDFIHRITAGSDYSIVGTGDAEKLWFSSGGYIELEAWPFGVSLCKIRTDKYQSGFGTVTIKYKDGSTKANCEADSWNTYTGKFSCTGWLKIRVEA